MNSILNIKISGFKDAKSTVPESVGLLTWLHTDKYKSLVEVIRATNDKLERAELKKRLPAITPSGIFSKRGKDGLISHSGFIQFDIDFTGNSHIGNFKELKSQICNIINVAYCGLSVSGNGFWGLIPIAFPQKHEAHFLAIARAFNSVGITIDPSCKDVCRLRFASYDPNSYFNPEAKTFTGLYEPPLPIKRNYNNGYYVSKPIEVAIKIINDASDGEKWLSLTKASYLLGGYIAGGEISESEAIQSLQAAITAKPEVKDLNAAFRTIENGIRNGKSKPIYSK